MLFGAPQACTFSLYKLRDPNFLLMNHIIQAFSYSVLSPGIYFIITCCLTTKHAV
jgi:hypothetical protein